MLNIPKLVEFKQKINALIDKQIQDYRLQAADPDYVIDGDRDSLISLMISYYDRVSMTRTIHPSDDDTDSDYSEIDLDPNLIDEDLIRYDASSTSDDDSELDELFDGRIYHNRNYSNDYYPTENQQEITKRVLGLNTPLDEFVDDDGDIDTHTSVHSTREKPQFPIFCNDSSVDPPAYETRDDDLPVHGSSSSLEDTMRALLERVAQLGDSYIVNNEKDTVKDYVSILNHLSDTDDDCIPIIDYKMPANCNHSDCNTPPSIQIDDSTNYETFNAPVLSNNSVPPNIPTLSEISAPHSTLVLSDNPVLLADNPGLSSEAHNPTFLDTDTLDLSSL